MELPKEIGKIKGENKKKIQSSLSGWLLPNMYK